MSHKQWRKIAKRERRRRIRIQKAKAREFVVPETNSSEYENWIKQQEYLELLEEEEIERINKQENEKWLQAEKLAIENWQKVLEVGQKLQEERIAHEAKLKQEWELEQKRRKDEVEKLKKIEEEKLRRQHIFMERLEEFLSGNATNPPPELLIFHETKPDTELCPFFIKTACCRFGDQCSRNHQYPGISKVLLATNFYTHFGLENANYNEYDTDLMLEYEERDTYKEFKEFYYDVLPEFKKFGTVVQFKVCNNHEKHLRGNTYIEYEELRSAVSAYRALHARWYGGRQISLQFCNIRSWSNAICGLQSRKRCPKGRACNFLHVFRNPENAYKRAPNTDSERRRRRSLQKSWRWSESPEPELPRKTSKSYEETRSEKKREDDKRRKEKRSSSSHRYHRHSTRIERDRSL